MNPVHRIHPKLQPYVMALTSHEFGLQGAQAEIRNIECGSIVANNRKQWGDRFHLRILYCTKKLTWQVLMCPNNLSEPPDFIMEDNFLMDADVGLIESRVPSLANWQPTDPKCLLNVVLELFQLYKHFQHEILSVNQKSRLYSEYNILLCEIPLTDVEIYVHNELQFSLLTHLKIDCSKLPMPVPKQQCLTLLLIELWENTKNVVTFFKTGELDEVFGNIDLPELECNRMLLEYIHYVEVFLQSKVNETVDRLNRRKLLYSHFVQYFEPAILNGDNITFHKLSFLLEANKVFYVLIVDIPINFPNDRPMITMSAMKKQKGGSTPFIQLKHFNYSPNWNVEKIFKNMLEFIKTSAISQYNKATGNEWKGRPK